MFELFIVQASRLEVLGRISTIGQTGLVIRPGTFEYLDARLSSKLWGWAIKRGCYLRPDQALGFHDGFVFATLLPIHHKVNHIDTFPMRLTIGGEAVGGIRLAVNLHRRGLVRMKGTSQHAILVRLEAIMAKHLGQGKSLFDLGDLHFYLDLEHI